MFHRYLSDHFYEKTIKKEMFILLHNIINKLAKKYPSLFARCVVAKGENKK